MRRSPAPPATPGTKRAQRTIGGSSCDLLARPAARTVNESASTAQAEPCRACINHAHGRCPARTRCFAFANLLDRGWRCSAVVKADDTRDRSLRRRMLSFEHAIDRAAVSLVEDPGQIARRQGALIDYLEPLLEKRRSTLDHAQIAALDRLQQLA